MSKYATVSGVIFGIVSVIQATRALYAWPLQIGTYSIPVYASWIAAVLAGSLCAWAFSSRSD